KREVVFYGTDGLRELRVRAIADAPASATAMDAVGAALQATALLFQENPGPARLRDTIMSANPELRERELIKLAELAAAMSGALRDRGIPEPAANLAAETGIAVFKVARARWLSEPGQPDLPAILRESMDELRGVLTDGAPALLTPSETVLPLDLPSGQPSADDAQGQHRRRRARAGPVTGPGPLPSISVMAWSGCACKPPGRWRRCRSARLRRRAMAARRAGRCPDT
ncbi:MAG: hypothetical protein LBV78_15035, partial [Kitasatospora sp.]|nr:hypothetical protein [Kitasatospora sp.]